MYMSSVVRLVSSLFHYTASLNVTDLCRKLVSGLGITNFSNPLIFQDPLIFPLFSDPLIFQDTTQSGRHQGWIKEDF